MTVPAQASAPGLLGRIFPAARPLSDLPERVARAIRFEQQRAEQLIGWVQLTILLTFAVLYALSPKTFMMDVPFAPVPWALGAWFVFTVARLAAAYRGPLPGWLLTASVVIDMTVLMVAVWSFHIQYNQPPAFYLKAPTLLYVFIFIALRALRFEARYVALAGVVAAAGWLVLLAYAALADSAGMPITRDYVTYMTSASILLGGEFDKIVSILMVTAILALALARARGTMFRAVSEGAAAMDLKRFFAPEVARRITGADMLIQPGQGELRDAAILFIDLRGFTPLSRDLEPNALMALLADYQSRMVPAIARHGGTLDKFLGDGIMASFGAARPDPTYAANALRAVDDVLAAAALWRAARVATGQAAPAIGIGLATGKVVFGAVGDSTRLEYTVIGDAVNLAAKLEKHNKVAKTVGLTTADSYALALTQSYREPSRRIRLDQAAVAGVEHPIDLAVLA
ncbi:MAG: adenylate/guanylate cyclase domain-containing protein [Proteobacteria bacterium]|nr:adenylate/guanylate cyclase domain-containing protein [Pseudomonadota bacterium]